MPVFVFASGLLHKLAVLRLLFSSRAYVIFMWKVNFPPSESHSVAFTGKFTRSGAQKLLTTRNIAAQYTPPFRPVMSPPFADLSYCPRHLLSLFLPTCEHDDMISHSSGRATNLMTRRCCGGI